MDSFFISKVLLTLVFLGIASYQDYKTRRVSNWIWILYLFFGLALTGFELVSGYYSVSYLYIAVIASSVFCLAGFMSKGNISGGDVKAFAGIMLTFPFMVTWILLSLSLVYILVLLYAVLKDLNRDAPLDLRILKMKVPFVPILTICTFASLSLFTL